MKEEKQTSNTAVPPTTKVEGLLRRWFMNMYLPDMMLTMNLLNSHKNKATKYTSWRKK